MRAIGGKKRILCNFCDTEILRSVKKDSLHSKQAEKIRIQRKRDSLRSKKSENFAIQRKSADDPFNFKKLENFWHSAEIEGCGSGGVVV